MVKTVNIFGVKHKVIIDNKLLEKYLEQIDSYSIDEIRGLYDDDERAIYIRDDMSQQTTLHTLLHEWLHGVGSVTGQPYLSSTPNKYDQFVDQVQLAVIDLLSQKDFVKYLYSLLDEKDTD